MQKQTGFTLIELSIVLVIIGLIIGGILVGRDMINAAEIRSTISQIEKYETANNVFRLKYNGMPGDLSSNMALTFGFQARTGAIGHGNGDFKFQSCDGEEINTLFSPGCETALYWRDLSQAGLIDTQLNTATDDPVEFLDGEQSLYFPEAKIKGNYIVAFFGGGGMGGLTNMYAITGLEPTTPGGEYDIRRALTVIQAYNIDSKIDNGLANTGRVLGGGNEDYLYFRFSAPTACTIVAGPNLYNLVEPYASRQLCQVYIQMK